LRFAETLGRPPLPVSALRASRDWAEREETIIQRIFRRHH
jgi:hypothetical protein